jgi:protein-disulfide isomerase
MKSHLVASLAVTAMLAGCSGGEADKANSAAPAKTVEAPKGTDWVSTVVKTVEGGFQMGNPDAAVKLIEYGALSCPHCAKFSRESAEGVKAMVGKGTLSYEFRSFLIHPQDVPASLVAMCNGPAPFFTMLEQLYTSQNDWLAKSSSITAEDQKSLAGADPLKTAQFMAGKLGLDSFAEQRGVPKSKVAACLSDQKALEALAKISEDGQNQYKITGTPTFVINGQVQTDTNEWKEIETRLKAAGA